MEPSGSQMEYYPQMRNGSAPPNRAELLMSTVGPKSPSLIQSPSSTLPVLEVHRLGSTALDLLVLSSIAPIPPLPPSIPLGLEQHRLIEPLVSVTLILVRLDFYYELLTFKWVFYYDCYNCVCLIMELFIWDF
jgi:hypothetical protein